MQTLKDTLSEFVAVCYRMLTLNLEVFLFSSVGNNSKKAVNTMAFHTNLTL